MKKILFIEDESALQKTLGAALKNDGFEVISAFDGAEGLRLAGEEKLDLIILDLILPKMDGFAVLEELKKTAKTKDISVIVLTNLEQPKYIEKVIDLGATTYLVKANYSLEEMVKKIKQTILNLGNNL